MKVAFVTPRYGAEVTGGAETGARQLAEHLVATFGWEVEAYTSCALDLISWANVLPAGTSVSNGVWVHRFEAVGGRPKAFFELDGRLRVAPRHASRSDAERWVELNGPVVPALVDALEVSDADVVAFYPYLFYPTVMGIARVQAPSVLHPAAHDEPALYLPVFKDVYRRADAICYHSQAERRLVQRVHQVADRPQIVLGLGVGRPLDGGRRGGDILGIGDRPYIVCVGRVDAHKGSTMLARFFQLFKERNPGPLALAFVGTQVADLGEHDDIVITGAVDEGTKWDLLRDAVALVSPSALESFSLVLMEAWQQARPVLVNALCDPTREHCQRSGGGLWFSSYRHFEAALNRLLSDPLLRQVLGSRGKAYVEQNYEWPVVIERYASFLEAVVERDRSHRKHLGFKDSPLRHE